MPSLSHHPPSVQEQVEVECLYCEQELACTCEPCACCNQNVNGQDEHICSTCEYGEACCCECQHCHRCGDRVSSDDYCSCCEYCESCCTCWYCEACQERHSESQGQCHCCECCYDSCECWSCESCGETFRPDDHHVAYCSGCDYCSDCCDCSSEEDEGDERYVCTQCPRTGRNGIVFHDDIKARYRKRFARFAACELEFEGVKQDKSLLYDWTNTWSASIVGDGSLGSNGFEIVTSPAKGERFTDQIKELCDILKKTGYHLSTNCGFHVHVDTRDFGYWDMRRLIKLWCKIEDAVFDLCPPSRRGNGYCKAVKYRWLNKLCYEACGSKPVKEVIFEGVYDINLGAYDNRQKGNLFRSQPDQRYNSARYAAMNLHSWFHRGTVEFRLGAGTGQFEKITNWTELLVSIVEFANTQPDRVIDNLPDNPWLALMQVAPEHLHSWLIQRRDKFAR